MPQLDFIGFHYFLWVLFLGFLVFYVIVISFLLKPIFFSRFLTVFFLKRIIFFLFYSFSFYRKGVVLTSSNRRLSREQLELLKKDNNPRLNWLKFVPKMGALEKSRPPSLVREK